MKYSYWIGAILLLCSSVLLADQTISPVTPATATQNFDWHNLADPPPCPGGDCSICMNHTAICGAGYVCCGRSLDPSKNGCFSDSPPIGDCCTSNGQADGQVVGACPQGYVCNYSQGARCVKAPGATIYSRGR